MSFLHCFPFTPFRFIVFPPSWFFFKCIFLKTCQHCQGDPLLFFTLHCTYDFRYSHKTDKIFVLKSRDQQKHEHQNRVQKYHQKSNLPLNGLSMRNNTPDEEENYCCLTMLKTFMKALLIAPRPKLFQFSFKNWMCFLTYLRDCSV